MVMMASGLILIAEGRASRSSFPSVGFGREASASLGGLAESPFPEIAFFEVPLLALGTRGAGHETAVLKFAVLAAQQEVFGVEVFFLIVFARVFGEPLLEVVAARLEASAVAHEAAFLIGLHLAALGPEVAQTALEELVLAEVAVELAIENLHLEAGAQADVFEEFLLGGDDPRLVAGKFVLEGLAYGLVKVEQVGGREAFTDRKSVV